MGGAGMYASVAADNGLEQRPKDYMESLSYILFFLVGKLPWMHCPISMTTEEYIASISYKKRHVPVKDYSAISPSKFATFLDQMKNLKYKDRLLIKIYEKYSETSRGG